MHAVALARELKVPRVIVPVNSSVFSAWGMLLTDLRRDYVQTRLLPLRADCATQVVAQFRTLVSEALAQFGADGITVSAEGLMCECLLDMRYVGQEHTVKVAVPIDNDAMDARRVAELFHAAHERRYTYRLASDIQIVNFHLVARVHVPKPELPLRAVTGRTARDAVLGRRRVDYDADGIHEATIYRGDQLEHGMELRGPAVVQEPVVTLLVGPGQRLTIDRYGDYQVEL
jgi:N-methylhydantoinase A